MNKALMILVVMTFSFVTIANAESDECIALKKMDYDQMRTSIVKASIVHYEGTVSHVCACPFSFDTISNGYCGANSAYYKNPKSGLKCFPQDVSFVDISNYKASVCGNSTSEENNVQPVENSNKGENEQSQDQ